MTSLRRTHPAIRKDHREKRGGCRSREPSCGLSRACVGYTEVAQSPKFGKTRSKDTQGEIVYWIQEASRKTVDPTESVEE